MGSSIRRSHRRNSEVIERLNCLSRTCRRARRDLGCVGKGRIRSGPTANYGRRRGSKTLGFAPHVGVIADKGVKCADQLDGGVTSLSMTAVVKAPSPCLSSRPSPSPMTSVWTSEATEQTSSVSAGAANMGEIRFVPEYELDICSSRNVPGKSSWYQPLRGGGIHETRPNKT